MNIAFPDDMRETLEREAEEAGIPTVDQYMRIMYERAKLYFGVNGENLWNDASDGAPTGPPWANPEVRKQLLALAEEGLASPPVADPHKFLTDLVRDTAAAEPTPR